MKLRGEKKVSTHLMRRKALPRSKMLPNLWRDAKLLLQGKGTVKKKD